MRNPNTFKYFEITSLTSKIKLSVTEKYFLLVSVSCLIIMAISDSAMGKEQHGAHTHGVATLTLVLERGALEVQFESPAMSVLGFEHSPKTKDQMTTIDATIALLSSTANVLIIEGGDCSPISADVNTHGPISYGLENQQGSDENHAEYSNSSDKHSEISATYVFGCLDIKKKKAVAVSFFELFPELEKIEVSWVTHNEQGQVVLDAKSTKIELW